MIVEKDGEEGDYVVFLVLDQVWRKLLQRLSSNPYRPGLCLPLSTAKQTGPTAASTNNEKYLLPISFLNLYSLLYQNSRYNLVNV